MIKKYTIFSISVISICLFFVFGISYIFPTTYSSEEYVEHDTSIEGEKDRDVLSAHVLSENITIEEEPVGEIYIAKHIQTPEQVKGIYMTSWVAGTRNFRDNVIDVIDSTEINTVVIDIKDDTGRISFLPNDPYLQEIGSGERRIADIRGLIELLHSKGIYVIGRISTFQDPYLIKQDSWKSEAVKQSDTKTLWQDRKGIGWFDAGSPKVWDYVIAIGHEAYAQGFDEINYDYIRFPSDGNMSDIYFPYSEGKEKSAVLKTFFEKLHDEFSDTDVVVSADLFGMTTSNTDDLGIGQILEDALVNVDYVLPMVYPSHYPKGWNGYSEPAKKPYEVIYKSMSDGVAKANAIGVDPKKLRPWLQDFNLGATYTIEMVRAQIQATYDVGLDSWIIWNPRNKYRSNIFHKED
ncbi:MAG: hypothetical protein ACI9AR_000187 [Flavobacteriaceae bacterium]|jgi:hypothetical protein